MDIHGLTSKRGIIVHSSTIWFSSPMTTHKKPSRRHRDMVLDRLPEGLVLHEGSSLEDLVLLINLIHKIKFVH